jgi:DNA repair protein RecN (Recombination protein N)
VITRIAIENLVVVDRAELEPGPGLTAITGETGAGKTLLATAIGLLFGADAAAGQVGPHADQAWVEGEFEVHDSFWAEPSVEALAAVRPDESNTLVLARRVAADGRTRAMAWGRTIAKADLEAAGSLLVAVAGQHAHRKLLAPSYQRELLDGMGGAAHARLVQAMADAWASLEAARAQHARVTRESARLVGEAERIADDLARIDAVDPGLDDEADLVARRDLVRNAATLHTAMATALGALEHERDGSVDTLGMAWSALDGVANIDPVLATEAARLLDLQSQAGDVASTLRMRIDELADAPTAVDEVEQRLSAYDELKRHFGGTTEAVIAARATLREQSELVHDLDGALQRAQQALDAAQATADSAGVALRGSRANLATRLANAVGAQLAELGMASSTFDVVLEDAPLAVHGADRVELRSAPSARHSPAPIAKAASGGELSRIALALHLVTGASEAGTIVFDEIDAGIGGHTAHAVATKLAQLAEHTQVVCITHLPQVAARASANVVVTRDERGTAQLTQLAGEGAVVDELVRMLGADASDDAAREHARGMRGPRVGASARGRAGASAKQQQSLL